MVPAADLLQPLLAGAEGALVALLKQGGLDATAIVPDAAGTASHVPGVCALRCGQPGAQRLMLSAGVHGDETLPIEMLARLLAWLAESPQRLALDVLIVIGNPLAISAGRRFVDADLNRMFRADRSSLGEMAQASEAARADSLMPAARAYLSAAPSPPWHLDLHSAIRPSLFPAFALLPDVQLELARTALLHWLAQAGVGAAVLTTGLSGTFSAWSAGSCGALAATLELGRVGAAGMHQLAEFAQTESALQALLQRRVMAAPTLAPVPAPRLFRAVRELIKHSEGFRPHFDAQTVNFTRFEAGSLLAEDGEVVYRVGPQPEYILFPNPEVRVGLRAGVMAVAL